MIGKVFQDQYKVVKAIGRGEFSEVYLGQDLKNEREIVIKVELKINYLLREAKLMKLFYQGIGNFFTLGFPDLIWYG
jgi:serine/threonine protein kinase